MIKTIHLKCSLAVLFISLINYSLLAQSTDPVDIAITHLQTQKEALGLTDADIAGFIVTDQYQTRHNGVTHLYLRQRHEGIEVENALNNFNILESGKVSSMGNRFVSNLAAKVNATTASLSPEDAVLTLIEKLEIETFGDLTRQEVISDQHILFFKEGIALEPISVKLMYQAITPASFKLSWRVSLYELNGQNWWVAYIDAQTGEMLKYRDDVIHCDFGKPGEICEDHVHHENEKHVENYANNNLISNAYNVFPMPIESPNHGNRSIVENPANLVASPYAWHDTDGEEGAEYTITRGNNVHAYHDIFDLNESIDTEPDGGDSLVFDLPFSETELDVYSQRDAAVTNLFYWNNIIHDVWYQYGFDEASGNYQENNYGNGGMDGDYVRAEALDGSGTNNANFASGLDGQRGRMQMYFWGNGGLPNFEDPVIEALEPAEVIGGYAYAQSTFGGQIPFDPIISEVILVNDSIGTFSDACETIQNGADFEGKIALIDRGDCQFGTKIIQAENLGAIAVIMCNNVAGAPINMGAGVDGDAVTIPNIMISLNDCNTLKMGLDSGLVVSIALADFEVPDPGPQGRDSDFDNGIIVHEYTHGISNRLTGGPNSGGCLSSGDQPEQAGEGWSDWFAMAMTTTSSMTAEQPRGIGTYVTNEPINGDGIRTFPYSRDMNVDPHTYADVNSEAVPHGVGSVWAVMIWDLYWNLVDLHGFDEDLYNGTGGNNMAMQLVLDGLKLQPCNPDFIEDRDAILEADMINYGGAHQCLIWETFARRGLGLSASSGGNEAFDIPSFCESATLKVFKTAVETVFAGEIITYELNIQNDFPDALTNVIISDFIPDGTSFVAGSLSCTGTLDGDILTIPVSGLEFGEGFTCTYQLITNQDLASSIAFEDGLEQGGGNWDRSAGAGTQLWLLNTANTHSGGFSWRAGNFDFVTDQYLDLEDPFLIESDNAVLSFWHEFDTEANRDGGVLEISVNGGAWEDADPYFTQNGYTGNLDAGTTNPLAGQPAFQGSSNGYIQSLVDLSSFANQEIQFRFRFATDDAGAADGWYLDDIQVFSELSVVVNQACVDSDELEAVCNSVITTVFPEPVATFENSKAPFDVALYPNPTTNHIWIEFLNGNSSAVNIKVFNTSGSLLSQNKLEAGTITHKLNLAHQPAGIYLVQIQTEEGVLSKRVVLQ